MSWEKAGKIAAEAREYGRKLIVEGADALEICEKVDEKIRELGGNPAFPTQVSMDEVAAHYCPDEPRKLGKELVSLDCGAEVDGYIGDTACTVDLTGENGKLIEVAEKALMEAISIIKPGIAIRDIGKIIEETIRKEGLQPVVNLSGHGLGRYEIHDSPSIPNIDNGNNNKLVEGMVFAIEPFVTSGVGKIAEVGEATVYSFVQSKGVRSPLEKKVLQVVEKFKVPFVTRWLPVKGLMLRKIMNEFERKQMVVGHPPLVEVSGKKVAQAEHSVMVTKDGCIVLTK